MRTLARRVPVRQKYEVASFHCVSTWEKLGETLSILLQNIRSRTTFVGYAIILCIAKSKTVKKKRNQFLQLLFNGCRVIKTYWQGHPWQAFSVLAMITIVSFSGIISSYIYGQLINQIVAYVSGDLISTNIIFQLFLLELFFGILISLLYRKINITIRIIVISFNNQTTLAITSKLADLDIAKHEDPKFRTVLNRINHEATHRPGNFINNFLWLLQDVIRVSLSIIVIMNISLVLVPIMILSLIPLIVIKIKSSQALWGIWSTKDHIRKKFVAAKNALSGIDMLKETRINQNKKYLMNIVQTLLKNFTTSQQDILIKENKQNSVAEIIETLLKGGIQGWFLLQVLAKQILIGDFSFYSSIIIKFIDSTKGLFSSVGQMYEDSIFMTEYYEVMDSPNEIIDNLQGYQIKTSPKIEFKKVSFKYPGTKRYILKDFSLTINPGEDIALVGENGAGKTTLVMLLARFYDVTSGKILLNGHDLKKINLDSWYEHLGILFQKFNTYSLTVQENIGLGRIGEINDLEKIKQVAEQSGANSFVKKFKHKYKTILSRWFVGGEELSGGQWQRVALARAFFRNADVLILDEPTASIDAKGEYEIFKKIAEFQKEKTTIIISHRFSTVRKADKILVMASGKIIEQGSHEQLMKLSSGTYKEMFTLQAEGYK